MTATPLFRDSKAPLEQRLGSLLEALTVDEKLSLCAGQGFWGTKPVPRLGIKSYKMTDGPRGVGFHSSGKRCTAFPSGISHAASWNEDLMQRFGAALGRETKAVGAKMVLAPAINITRTPLNGRTFEYLSEDPLLNSRLAVPLVKGIQGEGVAACIKHYCANNQETQRMSNSSEVSERALQEIYLPAFKAAVEQADAWSVMAAYNAVNGTPACENEDLLKRRLRHDWGFRGFVVTDWFAARRTSSPEACVKAGLGLEMPGKGSRYRQKNIKAAYDSGLFSEDELDENLSGLLRVMILSQHFDETADQGSLNTPEHQALAQEMAEQGMTLLKNDGNLLPLDPSKTRKIAVLGPKLKRRNCWPLWGGSAGVWPPHEVTPLRGLQAQNQDRFEWIKSPAEADAVLLFIGLSHRPGRDSEVRDRKSLELDDRQNRLVTDTLKKNSNTIVVLIHGGPVTMPWAEQVPAILDAWYPGMEGGTAIANTLFGDNNPSGKLPVTFPQRLSDSPAHDSERTFPGVEKKVYYEEELFVGYRHFDKQAIEPLFPFGHGLSYTSFDYSQCQLTSSSLAPSETLEVTVTITNTGKCYGQEVVQLYVADLQADDDRPEQALKDFAKIGLEAGQSRSVMLKVPVTGLQFFCPRQGNMQIAKGRYEVRIGSSSRDIRLSEEFALTTIDNKNERQG
ncbi:MAG: glycoside hydrolase family 3 C-terminal domain-containing protein [Halioglobus sp.]